MKNESWIVLPKKGCGWDGKLGIEFAWPKVSVLLIGRAECMNEDF